MASNYPPGVTGHEYAIAGPDYEKESETPCPHNSEEEGGKMCGADTMEMGYRSERWLTCVHDHTTELEPLDEGPDPDRAYDEARERRLFPEEED